MDYFLLEELRRILLESACDLNEAAKSLGVPVSVVHSTFADGLLKGYWKIAGGQLLINLPPDDTGMRHSSSSSPKQSSSKANAA